MAVGLRLVPAGADAPRSDPGLDRLIAVVDRLEASHGRRRRRARLSIVPGAEAIGTPRLECVECGSMDADAAAGWRTYLTVDDEPATYCPDCAAAEFGEKGTI